MTTETREALKLQLMRDEGIALTPYVDTVGKITIGIGRNLTDKGISAAEADFLFDRDLNETLEACARFPWFDGLDPVRQCVIANMCFNLGPTRLRTFTNTLAMIRRGDYEDAATQMLKSKWAHQVKGRAIRLSEMMRTGRA